MLNSASRIGKLFQAKIPILYLDTCAILDILRDPTRKDVRVHNHEAYLSLLREAESGSRLMTFISDTVKIEFWKNIQGVQDRAEKDILNLGRDVDKLDKLVNLHGIQGRTDSSHWKCYVEWCRNAADRWIKYGILLPESDQIHSRAYERVVRARTPASKGSNSIKDCVILETYYHHLCGLRSNGIKAPAVFVSSNVKDFAEPRGGGIRSDIKNEFQSLGLEYAPNMSAARHFLKL